MAVDARPIQVLVVDDIPANLRLLDAVLSPRGFVVQTGASGAEPRSRCIAEQDIDVVLLDVNMPGMSGYEVCRRIRDDPRTRLLPVVMVTAAPEEERVLALEAGADDFLRQPLEQAELLARVRSLARLKRYHDALDRQAVQLTAWNQTLGGAGPGAAPRAGAPPRAAPVPLAPARRGDVRVGRPLAAGAPPPRDRRARLGAAGPGHRVGRGRARGGARRPRVLPRGARPPHRRARRDGGRLHGRVGPRVLRRPRGHRRPHAAGGGPGPGAARGGRRAQRRPRPARVPGDHGHRRRPRLRDARAGRLRGPPRLRRRRPGRVPGLAAVRAGRRTGRCSSAGGPTTPASGSWPSARSSRSRPTAPARPSRRCRSPGSRTARARPAARPDPRTSVPPAAVRTIPDLELRVLGPARGAHRTAPTWRSRPRRSGPCSPCSWPTTGAPSPSASWPRTSGRGHRPSRPAPPCGCTSPGCAARSPPAGSRASSSPARPATCSTCPRRSSTPTGSRPSWPGPGRPGAEGRPNESVAGFREALALWRGPALAEVAGSTFATSEAIRLEQLRVLALEECLAGELACGRHREVMPELEAPRPRARAAGAAVGAADAGPVPVGPPARCPAGLPGAPGPAGRRAGPRPIARAWSSWSGPSSPTIPACAGTGPLPRRELGERPTAWSADRPRPYGIIVRCRTSSGVGRPLGEVPSTGSGGCSSTARAPAFQAGGAGSIPVTRSIQPTPPFPQRPR